MLSKHIRNELNLARIYLESLPKESLLAEKSLKLFRNKRYVDLALIAALRAIAIALAGDPEARRLLEIVEDPQIFEKRKRGFSVVFSSILAASLLFVLWFFSGYTAAVAMGWIFSAIAIASFSILMISGRSYRVYEAVFEKVSNEFTTSAVTASISTLSDPEDLKPVSAIRK